MAARSTKSKAGAASTTDSGGGRCQRTREGEWRRRVRQGLTAWRPAAAAARRLVVGAATGRATVAVLPSRPCTVALDGAGSPQRCSIARIGTVCTAGGCRRRVDPRAATAVHGPGRSTGGTSCHRPSAVVGCEAVPGRSACVPCGSQVLFRGPVGGGTRSRDLPTGRGGIRAWRPGLDASRREVQGQIPACGSFGYICRSGQTRPCRGGTHPPPASRSLFTTRQCRCGRRRPSCCCGHGHDGRDGGCGVTRGTLALVVVRRAGGPTGMTPARGVWGGGRRGITCTGGRPGSPAGSTVQSLASRKVAQLHTCQ